MFGIGKKKSDGANSTRIFYATDIHGSDVCFRKFCSALDFYKADLLILGGDMTGKMVVPVVEERAGRYRTQFSGQTLSLDGEADLQRYVKQMRDQGFYPKVMDQDEFKLASESPEEQERIFHELIAERIDNWSEYAANKFKGRDVRIYCAPGNDDDLFIDALLDRSEIFDLVEGRKVLLPDGREMISTGWANPTPWNTERECPEETLEDRLSQLAGTVADYETAIFSIHPPPYNTKIDECPSLDENLRPISDMGQPVMKPVGSTSVRKIIETHQPLLSIHGHIHEGRGMFKLGRTMCVNPGSDYTEGTLRGCLLTLEQRRVADVQFTTG